MALINPVENLLGPVARLLLRLLVVLLERRIATAEPGRAAKDFGKFGLGEGLEVDHAKGYLSNLTQHFKWKSAWGVPPSPGLIGPSEERNHGGTPYFWSAVNWQVAGMNSVPASSPESTSVHLGCVDPYCIGVGWL